MLKSLSVLAASALFLMACAPEEKIVYRDVPVDMMKTNFNPCDRGVDFNSPNCDRKIDDHTFWFGKKNFKAQIKNKRSSINTNIDVSFAYEFSPLTNTDVYKPEDKVIGKFKRAAYMMEPQSKRQLGYYETGVVTRISHNAIDFTTEKTSCDGKMKTLTAETSKSSLYYKRYGNDMELKLDKPDNSIFGIIMKIPVFFVKAAFDSIAGGMFTYSKVQELFKENIALNPYQFQLELLPVEWGCSVNGEFVQTLTLIE